MNIERNRKPHSLRFKLIVPTTALFIIFSLGMTLAVYFSYSNDLTTQTLTQIKSMSQQVLSNYNTYFESVIDVSNNLQVRVDNIDLGNYFLASSTSQYFDDVLSFKDEIKEIGIYDGNGNLIVSNSNNRNETVDVSESWFQMAVANPLINIFSRVDKFENNYFFTMSKYISYNKGYNNAILKIDFDFKKIINLIAQTDLGSGGHITIYDNYYNIVYTSAETIPEVESTAVKSLIMGIQQVRLDNDLVLFASTITNTTWRVAIFTNNDGLDITLRTFLVIVFSISFALIIIFTFIVVLLSNSITNPLRELQKEMTKVENFNYEITKSKMVEGSIEVNELSKSFSQMMTRIKELMQKVVVEQEEQRKSELKALQNQINPHFLYNTFDSVIYMIDKGENEKAEEMIVALSKFFRISVSKGRNIIPLEKEIEHAKYYLQIQKLRFGDTFTFNFNVDQKLYNYNVIKLILQPIIENAIGHGIDERGDSIGNININGYEEDGLIYLEIVDNGFGILPEKIKEIYASFDDSTIHNGVGLKNVYERIRIYYGSEANIKIESELDVGTKITIIIPVKGALKNEEE